MNNYIKLEKKLDKGLYIQNIYEMVKICKKLSKTNLLPFYVIQSLLLDVAKEWDGESVTVEQTQFVEENINKPIKKILDLIDNNASEKELYVALELVISGYLKYKENK